MSKRYKQVVIFLIYLTTVPFVFLLLELDLSRVTPSEPAYWQLLGLSFGSIAGFVGLVLLYWQFILGMRFISSRFSHDIVWFNQLHKFLGLYGVTFALMHPFLIMFAHMQSFTLVLIPDLALTISATAVNAGRLAFYLLLIIWITSAFFRKKLGFRTWKLIHFLAYPLLFFALTHVYLISTSLIVFPLLKFMWFVLSGIFVYFLLLHILKTLGVGKYNYKLVKKDKVEPDIFIYEFEPLSNFLVPAVGQFCYIQLKKFGEEHPFTIMEFDSESKKIRFGIKAQGIFTKQLSELNEGVEVKIDGPYGIYTIEGHNEAPKVLIAGGIGVTPFVDLVRKFGNDSTYMFYCNRFLNNAVRRDLFKEKLDGRYFDVLSDEKINAENILSERLSIDMLKKFLPSTILKSAEYFICGSKPFYENYKKMLIDLRVPVTKIHYEEFGF